MEAQAVLAARVVLVAQAVRVVRVARPAVGPTLAATVVRVARVARVAAVVTERRVAVPHFRKMEEHRLHKPTQRCPETHR